MSPVSLRLTMAAAFVPLESHRHHSRIAVKGLGAFCGEEFVCGKAVCWDGKGRNLNIIRLWSSRRDEPLLDESLRFGAATGLEPILNNLSKWLVSVLTSAIILWRHDAEGLWAATGAVLNIGLSIALKNILNQERPVSTLRSDPGMPSSHAQSFFYTVTFLCVSLVERHGMNAVTAILSGIFFVVSSYFSWLRVSQQLHTVSQVIVGAVVGLIFCLSWFWSWYAFILDHFTSLWVKIVLTLGGAGFCFCFLYLLSISGLRTKDD